MTPLFRAAMLAGLMGLAGCTDAALDLKANKELSSKMLAAMTAKGMTRSSPIMVRIFKEEGKLEVWKQKTNGRFDQIAAYSICKWSGKLGPKFMEGDRQAPEGFYTVRPAQMNPNSSYHLSFNIGYPNAYDRIHGRTGSNLMVHGACSSSGCYSMTDAQVEEIYAFGRDAFKGGQREFQIQAFPFRMTDANMARYKDDPNQAFWRNLKEGYDRFEAMRVPSRVDVCERRYVFDAAVEPGRTLSPTGPCPASTQPDTLQTAFKSDAMGKGSAFAMASGNEGSTPPKPSIAGVEEAKLVSEWSKKKARGERIPIDPPSLERDGTVRVTSRMGRIDSELGRKMAEKDAVEEAKKQAAEEKKLAAAQAKAEKEAAKFAAAQAKAAAEAAVAQPAPEPAPPPEKPGMLGGLRKRLGGLFGG